MVKKYQTFYHRNSCNGIDAPFFVETEVLSAKFQFCTLQERNPFQDDIELEDTLDIDKPIVMNNNRLSWV